jgi:hypothetical protein
LGAGIQRRIIEASQSSPVDDLQIQEQIADQVARTAIGIPAMATPPGQLWTLQNHHDNSQRTNKFDSIAVSESSPLQQD